MSITPLPLWAAFILSVAVLIAIVLVVEYKAAIEMGWRSLLVVMLLSIGVWFIPVNGFFTGVVFWTCLLLAFIIIYRKIGRININDDCMTDEHYNPNESSNK